MISPAFLCQHHPKSQSLTYESGEGWDGGMSEEWMSPFLN
jgi:hypothetical protein